MISEDLESNKLLYSGAVRISIGFHRSASPTQYIEILTPSVLFPILRDTRFSELPLGVL